MCFRSVRMIDFNQPETLSRAMVGRRIHFPRRQPDWPPSPMVSIVMPLSSSSSIANIAQADATASSTLENCSNQGVKFTGRNHVPLQVYKDDNDHDDLEVSLGLDWSGMQDEDLILGVPLFSGTRKRKWRKFLVVAKCAAKNKLCLKIMDENGRTRSFYESSSIQTGSTHIRLKITDGGQLLSFYMADAFETSMKMPKKARPNGLVYIGGIPSGTQRKLSLHNRGISSCLDHVEINGKLLSSAILKRQAQGPALGPCPSVCTK